MFSDSPVRAMTMKAPMKAAGRPSTAHSASRGRKKRLITSTTSTRPIRPLPTSICRRSRTMLVASWVSVSETPPSRRWRSASSSDSSRSLTVSASSRSALLTSSTSAGSPLKRTCSSARSPASVMVASSPRVSSPPPASETTTSAASSAGERRWSVKRSRISRSAVSRVPRGRARLWPATRRASSRAERPCCPSTSRGTSTCHWRRDMPWIATRATPGRVMRRSSRRRAYSSSWRIGISPETATAATRSLRWSSRTTGGSARAGSSVMALTSVSISLRKRMASPPAAMVAVALARLSWATQPNSSRNSTPLTASNRRRQIASSTSAALAPR